MSITGRGLWLLAALSLTPLVLPGPMGLALFGLGVVAILTDAWTVRAPPSIEVVAPTIVSRGVPTPLRVVVEPAARVKLVGTADIEVDPDEGRGGLAAEIVARRRGSHTLPGPATLTTGPLGLGSWHHRSAKSKRLTVYPDMAAARRLAEEVRLGRFGESNRRSRGPLGLGTELESIRDYQPDDDIRQVNWRATARVGTPMSNTFRIEQEREVLLLVDTGRLMAAPVGDDRSRTRLDVAVDAAAAVASVADVLGDRVGVLAFDAIAHRRLLPRRDGGRAVVAALYDLEPTSNDTDFELAFRSVAHHKRAFLLLLTDILEETASLPLTSAMPILARHHAVCVAGVRDPAVAAALEGEDRHRALVAADIEASRRRVAAILARYGSAVVDAAPDRLARLCVEAYVRAKRRARL